MTRVAEFVEGSVARAPPRSFDGSGTDFRGWCRQVGFRRFQTVHLQGAHSAAIAWK